MNQADLIEIRCPFKRRSKTNNKVYPCNHLCVRVTAGSGGEAYCLPCKLTFAFEVNDQAFTKTSVKVQS